MSAPAALISGAGIAGPTLAYWLLRAGWTPTLIERAPEARKGGYVIDFWGLGYDIAERMGLAEEIQRIGYHVQELRIVGDRGGRTAGFGAAVFRQLTGGRYVTVKRTDLAALLLAKVATGARSSSARRSSGLTRIRGALTFASAGAERVDLTSSSAQTACTPE